MSTYDFYLRGDNGRYDYETRISLPSVTTVVSAVLAKPQLVAWAYERTLDAVTGLVSHIHDADAATADEIFDTLSDYDLLDEWIRANEAHYTDASKAAAERGQAAHALLAHLVLIYQQEDEAAAHRYAGKDHHGPYKQAVAQWWLDRQPHPLESEKVVFSLRHGYAGRFDLLADFGLSVPKIIDLKTRRAGLGVYKSDEVQLGGYKIAAEERGVVIGGTSVLLAHDDGTYEEVETWVEPEAFLKIVEVYYMLRKTRIE